MPESTTPPGRIEVGRIGAIPIYFNAAEKKFEATIEGPARRGGYGPQRQVITRKDMASVEREILKNTSARVEVIRMPAKKGRTRYLGYRSPEEPPPADEYGPRDPLAGLPAEVLVITAEGGRRDSGTAFRTEQGAFVHGPFARRNDAVTGRLRALLERYAKTVADFEREWDAIIREYEPVSNEQITAEIRASVSAAKSKTTEAEA